MSQISIFDGANPLLIDKPIRLIELFAGYGSQSLGLKYLGVPFEHHRICEWAIPSIKAYKDLHFADDSVDYANGMSKDQLVEELLRLGVSVDYNKPATREQLRRRKDLAEIYNDIQASHNLVSVTNVKGTDFCVTDTDKYTYIMTYSFPCQDLSVAGNMEGMTKGSGTRSGLLWEVERILSEMPEKPQILVMENVKQVCGSRNRQDFNEWLNSLEAMGYKSWYKVLNGKDFGIPQNRERCFMVSAIGDYYYEFPQGFKLELRLKNVLDKNVPERYYLNDKAMEYVGKREGKYTQIVGDEDIAKSAVTAKGTQNWTGNFYSQSVSRETVGAVRRGGRGSLDRHSWDIVFEEEVEYEQ